MNLLLLTCVQLLVMLQHSARAYAQSKLYCNARERIVVEGASVLAPAPQQVRPGGREAKDVSASTGVRAGNLGGRLRVLQQRTYG